MNASQPAPRATLSLIPPYHPGKRVTGAVKLSSNENPLGCSDRAREAVISAMREPEVYPDGRGTALVEELAQLHGVTPEQVILGNGSDDIMIMAAASFIEPGTDSVMAAPTFSQYEFAVRLYGGDVLQVPLVDGVHDLEAMLQAVSAKTRIVWLCNPNNPTGTYISHSDVERFLQRIPGHVLVVLDEAYAEFATAADYPDSQSLLKAYSNLLILRTFSKIHGLAALRLGFGMTSAATVEYFLRVKQPFNVNAPAQAAGLAAVRDTEFVERSLQVNREGMLYVTGELDRLQLDYYPSQTNFVCIQLPTTGREAYKLLLKHGITVRDLASFGLERSIRVSIGSMDALQALVRGLGELCELAGR